MARRVGGQSRQRDSNESERSQHRQNGGDGDGGGENRAGDPSAGELVLCGDTQEPGPRGDVEQRSTSEEEPDSK